MDKVCFFYFVILCTVSREMKAEEVANDTATDMKDYSPKCVMHGRLHARSGDINDSGVIPRQVRSSASSVLPKRTLHFSLTDSMKCHNYGGCRGILKKISETQTEEHGHLMDNFHILPDGRILGGLGWDEVYENVFRVNLFAEGKNTLPSNETLEAFAYFVHLAVRLKGMKYAPIYGPENVTNYVLYKVREWAKKNEIRLNEDNSIRRVSIYDEGVISRVEWNALTPTREFETSEGKADVIEVTKYRHHCYTTKRCLSIMRRMQEEQIPTDGDIFPNFVIGGDGRVYEGLGWNSSRKDKVVYFALPATDAIGYVPRTHVMSAFSLQLREGVDLGWISEKYTVNVASDMNQNTSAKILKWGEWTRHQLRENTTTYLETSTGEEITVADDLEDQLDVVPLKHPVGTIYFTQSNAGCSEVVDCLPFLKSIGGKTLRSKNQVKSNFYFADDGRFNVVLYEGLGWDQTTKEDHVFFEFLTPDVNTLPSSKSMAASTFLIREALKNGIFRSSYRIIVAENTSVEFEKLVKLWDRRIRKPTALKWFDDSFPYD